MAKRMKQTENQKAYQKERRRLLQAVRRGEKEGYIFPEDVVPDLPKRVTKKQLDNIKKIKPKQLYKNAVFVYQETGKVVPAEQRKQEVKQEAISKAKEVRKRKKKISTPSVPTYYPTISIIDTIRDRISELTREAKPPFPIEHRKNELLSIFEDTVTMYGDNIIEYEDYLEAHESEIAELLNVISYDSNSEQISASFVALGKILNTKSLSMSQAENLSAMAEYYDL